MSLRRCLRLLLSYAGFSLSRALLIFRCHVGVTSRLITLFSPLYFDASRYFSALSDAV